METTNGIVSGLTKRKAPDKFNNNTNTNEFWNSYTKQLSERTPYFTTTNNNKINPKKFDYSARKLGRRSWFTCHMRRLKPLFKLEKTTWTETEKIVMRLVKQKQKEDELKKIKAEQDKKKRAEEKKKDELEEDDDEPKEEKKEKKKFVKSTKIPAGKAKKILLKPTKEQKKKLNEWFNTCRWIYNKCVAEIQTNGKKGHINAKHLRKLFGNNNNFKNNDTEWVLNTPSPIRDEAIQDLLKAYKSNYAKFKKKKKLNKPKKKQKKEDFIIHFKSKKNKSDSIVIHDQCWNKGRMYPIRFGKEPLVGVELLPDKLGYDTRLQRTRFGKFYLCILKPLEIKPDNQGPYSNINGEGNVIALDPGVRTFMTGYDPS